MCSLILFGNIPSSNYSLIVAFQNTPIFLSVLPDIYHLMHGGGPGWGTLWLNVLWKFGKIPNLKEISVFCTLVVGGGV